MEEKRKEISKVEALRRRAGQELALFLKLDEGQWGETG